MTEVQYLEKENTEIGDQIEHNAKKRDCHFVKDGVIDPAKYLKAKYRILWILREANSQDNSWSYLKNFKRNDWLKTYGRSNPTLRKLIYTTFGVLRDTEWCNIPFANEEDAFGPLQEIALINIKKMPGSSRVVGNTIQEAYYEDQDLLKRQIEACNADIVIFGGSFRYFYKTDFKGLETAEKKITELGNHYYNTGEKLYINSWHPSATNNTDKDYVMDIVNIVRNWKRKKQSTCR